jgi:hypothetical protein
VFCKRLTRPGLCTWQGSCAIMAIALGEARKYPVTGGIVMCSGVQRPREPDLVPLPGTTGMERNALQPHGQRQRALRATP